MQIEIAQTVTVAADTSATGAALALGRTFTSREIDELPVSSRDFVSLALLTPGLFLDRSTSRSQNVTIAASGQNGRSNTLLADGLTLDEHFTGQARGSFSLDAVKEFMVRANNFSAEYGQASGAIVVRRHAVGHQPVHGPRLLLAA